jgi:ABC-type molybdenum transport system ATPase subunit/photorepair protein PhrA
MLFTWREITRMRNSVATNLLIMDEVFDGSLDMNAGNCLLSILTKMKKSNIFVISHTGTELYDKLHGNIKITKQHGFARIL